MVTTIIWTLPHGNSPEVGLLSAPSCHDGCKLCVAQPQQRKPQPQLQPATEPAARLKPQSQPRASPPPASHRPPILHPFPRLAQTWQKSATVCKIKLHTPCFNVSRNADSRTVTTDVPTPNTQPESHNHNPTTTRTTTPLDVFPTQSLHPSITNAAYFWQVAMYSRQIGA